jgi:glycine hydroxymethyltransferase
MVLLATKPKGADGARAERALETINIACNKNTLPSGIYSLTSLIIDTSAINPGGIRVGAPAMTTRGFQEPEFVKIVDFIDRAIKVAAEIQKSLPKEANKLKDWKAKIGDGSGYPELVQLRKEVNELAGKYPLPALLE